MNPSIQHLGAVTVTVWVPLMIGTIGMMVRDWWRNRWSQRFRDEDAELFDDMYALNDYHAFFLEARRGIGRIRWGAVVMYPIAFSIGVSVVWWALTVLATVMVRL